jgi:ubiquinone/menaquinone biosynthesis C-methylase UbiE
MERENRHGILMHGLGRWLVYSRPRAWIGQRLELPRLLKGVELPPHAQCLDLATGLGWATAGIARTTPSATIVSVDYDFEVLPRAREYLNSQGSASNATLCRADGKRLPFRDRSFDLVVCLYGLHHFRGYLDGLKDIARVLKPSGAFALIDPVRSKDQPLGGHRGLEVLTRTQLTRLLEQAGLEVISSRVSYGAARMVARNRIGRELPAEVRTQLE